jgi:hypothetical protein
MIQAASQGRPVRGGRSLAVSVPGGQWAPVPGRGGRPEESWRDIGHHASARSQVEQEIFKFFIQVTSLEDLHIYFRGLRDAAGAAYSQGSESDAARGRPGRDHPGADSEARHNLNARARRGGPHACLL